MLARIHKSMEERDEGFTLIELLVVIIIIGILAAIAIPVFLSQRNKGYDSQAKSDARNLATLQETYFNDQNYYQVGAALANVQSALPDYKKSGGVSAPLAYAYAESPGVTKVAAGATTGVKAFCVQATSQSGNKYVWQSWAGGLQTTTNANCP